jgi:hypothetical protein
VNIRSRKAIILPFVLYWCDMLSAFTLGSTYVSGNRVLIMRGRNRKAGANSMIRENMGTTSQVTLCWNFSRNSKICVHAVGVVTSAYMTHRYCIYFFSCGGTKSAIYVTPILPTNLFSSPYTISCIVISKLAACGSMLILNSHKQHYTLICFLAPTCIRTVTGVTVSENRFLL